jgi:hypothetical protein
VPIAGQIVGKCTRDLFPAPRRLRPVAPFRGNHGVLPREGKVRGLASAQYGIDRIGFVQATQGEKCAGNAERGGGRGREGLGKRAESDQGVFDRATPGSSIGPCLQHICIGWQIAPGLRQHDLGLRHAPETQQGAGAAGIGQPERGRLVAQQRPEACCLHPLTRVFRAQGTGQGIHRRFGRERMFPARGRHFADLGPGFPCGTAVRKQPEPLARDPLRLV